MELFTTAFDRLTPFMAIVCFTLPIMVAIGDLRMRRKGQKLSSSDFLSRIRLFGFAPLLGLSAMLMFVISHSSEQQAQSISDGAFFGGIGYGLVVIFAVTMCRAILYRKGRS